MCDKIPGNIMQFLPQHGQKKSYTLHSCKIFKINSHKRVTFEKSIQIGRI